MAHKAHFKNIILKKIKWLHHLKFESPTAWGLKSQNFYRNINQVIRNFWLANIIFRIENEFFESKLLINF